MAVKREKKGRKQMERAQVRREGAKNHVTKTLTPHTQSSKEKFGH